MARLPRLPLPLLLWLAACSADFRDEYEVPDATIIAYKPRGLHISIPDSEGVSLFAVHANINKEMGDRETGEIARDIIRPRNGRWVYEDKRIRLKEGDVINYWLYVVYNGLGYPKDFLTWTVTELVDRPDEPQTQPQPQPQPKPTSQPQTQRPTICQNSITTVNSQTTCSGQLIFEETFDSLQDSKWERVAQFGASPGYPFVMYTRNDTNSFVSGGNLNIVPSLLTEEVITTGKVDIPRCTGTQGSDECYRQGTGGFFVPPVLTAQLRTRQSFNFRYGKVEVRAKFPLGDWIYPEIQLKPTNYIYGSNPRLASGQVNLALARGNRELTANGEDLGARVLESSCEMGYGVAMHRETVKRPGEGFWGDAFHVYGLTWSPDEMVFTVDGNVVGSVPAPADGFQSKPQFSGVPNVPWSRGSKFAPFDQEFYISLGLAVGGFCEFPDNSVSSNGHKMPWRNRQTKTLEMSTLERVSVVFWRIQGKPYDEIRDEFEKKFQKPGPVDETIINLLNTFIRTGSVHDQREGGRSCTSEQEVKAAIANFWNDRNTWFSTWHPPNGPPQNKLQVDYVKVYAL